MMAFPMDPEEARAAMERAAMHAALQVHTFNEMLDDLSEDRLRALASIFEGCMQHKRVAPQIYGQITAILRIRHNTCQCGVDHAAEFDVDKAFEKMTGEMPSPLVAVESMSDEEIQEFKSRMMGNPLPPEDDVPPADPNENLL